MSELEDGALSDSGLRSFKRPNLERLVCEALARDQRVDASQIGVARDAATGDLTLFGTVPDRDQSRAAEDCAASVKGVHVVHNRLTVAVNNFVNKSDSDGAAE